MIGYVIALTTLLCQECVRRKTGADTLMLNDKKSVGILGTQNKTPNNHNFTYLKYDVTQCVSDNSAPKPLQLELELQRGKFALEMPVGWLVIIRRC